MTKKIKDILDKQIQEEFYSSYLYLALAARLESLNFKGMANWMQIQAKEENDHALGLFRFLIDRDEEPRLMVIAEAKVVTKTPQQVFAAGLAHEKHITACISKIYELAKKEKDYALESFIKWYIDEQVEEEANASEIVAKLKLIGNNGSALYALDRELAARTYTPSSPYASKTA